MNPVINQAKEVLAASAAEGTLMGVMTIVFLGFFVGWAVWAWLPANKGNMDAAARMPLDDGAPTGGEA
jgi:cbb3-type cytochrome oxidase subunit 3